MVSKILISSSPRPTFQESFPSVTASGFPKPPQEEAHTPQQHRFCSKTSSPELHRMQVDGAAQDRNVIFISFVSHII